MITDRSRPATPPEGYFDLKVGEVRDYNIDEWVMYGGPIDSITADAGASLFPSANQFRIEPDIGILTRGGRYDVRLLMDNYGDGFSVAIVGDSGPDVDFYKLFRKMYASVLRFGVVMNRVEVPGPYVEKYYKYVSSVGTMHDILTHDNHSYGLYCTPHFNREPSGLVFAGSDDYKYLAVECIRDYIEE